MKIWCWLRTIISMRIVVQPRGCAQGDHHLLIITFIACEVPGASGVDECVFQYLTQCLSTAVADHAGDDAKVVSS